MLTFLKALLAAILGGAVTSVTEVLSAPGNTNPYDMGRLRNAAIAGALVGLVGYLKQSPIETDEHIQGKAALAREQAVGAAVQTGKAADAVVVVTQPTGKIVATGINPGK